MKAQDIEKTIERQKAELARQDQTPAKIRERERLEIIEAVYRAAFKC